MNIPWLILIGCANKEPSEPTQCAAVELWQDSDGDGFGTPYSSTTACAPQPGYVDNNGDCDDEAAEAFPGQEWFLDVDGDGYGDSSQKLLSCMPPLGHC